jgi:hypothetical protein
VATTNSIAEENLALVDYEVIRLPKKMGAKEGGTNLIGGVAMGMVVQIRIYGDPNNPSPTLSLPDVPWFAGITALQAMIIAEAMNPINFVFRVEYRSIYGAQIDSIDGVTDDDTPNCYWLLWIDHNQSAVGASEAILMEDPSKTTALVEWKFTDISAQPSDAVMRKISAV